ncbi:MAG: glycosyltransferase, partial [Pseudomonadota bacterium]
VVAGDFGGVTDIVLDGETGIVTPPYDVDAFAEAVRLLLTDVEKRQALGHAAFQNVQDNHGLNHAADRLDEALHGLTFAGDGPDLGSFGF